MQKFKVLYLIIFLGAIVSFLIGAMGSVKDDQQNSNEGRINFSHKNHLELTDCESCHSAVQESVTLKDKLFPNHQDCSSCHEVNDESECSTCHKDNKYEPLVKSKSILIFNHKLHLSNPDLSCESCHQGLRDVDFSSQSPNTFPPMETCYTCHNNKTVATSNCESCHISTVNLLPQDHKVVSFINNHKFAAQQFNANCAMCHDSQRCEDCHIATTGITEANKINDFYQPYYPGNFKDDAKQQSISRVHELNYRFIHGIDAKGKTAECQTCHQIETFCAECHQANEEDFAFGGIVPASHLKSTFKTIGVGTGGGEHAILAKRDIETCISCHDVNGADPTCITCHLDSDGIKGTNPKTHPAGFMRDEKGDWHNDQSSVCYNCHTSFLPQSASGVGFCGYCHGSKN